MTTSPGCGSVAARFLATWLLLTGGSACAATIHVPADRPTIGAAIAAAGPGDVIQVAAGTYHERIDVPPLLDDLTIDGGGGAIIEDVPPTGANLVRIRANGVLFQDFTLRGGNTAVRLDGSSGSTVRFVTIETPRAGVRVTNGESNEISDCVIVEPSRGLGVEVANSDFISLIGVWVISAPRDGIRVRNALGAYVHANAVDDPRGDAIRLQRVNDGLVDLNLTQNGLKDGLHVSRSPGVVLESNDAAFHQGWGFRVEHSPPILSPTDLQDAGNVATENVTGDFLVVP